MNAFKVLTAEWCHETNTFSKVPTTLANFQAQYCLLTPQEIASQRLGTKTVIGATYEAAEKHGWALTTTLCASANPTGAVTSDTFTTLSTHILQPMLDGERFDGILLHLHGAMVSEDYEDAEGELLRRLRELQPTVPVIVTLDLHANVTPAMAELSSLMLAVRTYPHIDFYETACRAADLLQLTMTGVLRPIIVLAKRPMLRGLDGGKTHAESPMSELIARGARLEEQGSCLAVSVCAGFMAADIHYIGPSVAVTVDLNKVSDANAAIADAQTIADSLMDHAWATRAYSSEHHLTVGQAVQKALAHCSEPLHEGSSSLLVMADVSDNPGSGHYGDTTSLLRGLVDADVPDLLFYAIFDPSAALQAQAIGVGKTGKVVLGGRGDPSLGGGPLELEVQVAALTDGCFRTYGPMGFGGMPQNYGLSALLRVGHRGLEVIVITNNGQLLDNAQITSLGVDLAHKRVVAVKSKHHFRACLTPLAKEVVTVDGEGMGSALLVGGTIKEGMYKRVRRPIWPLDAELDNC